jgi:hypothetical protein
MKISLRWNQIKTDFRICFKMAHLAPCLTGEMIPLPSSSNLKKEEAQLPTNQAKGISNGNSQIVLLSMVAHHSKSMAVRMTSIMTTEILLSKLYRMMKTF